MTETCFQIAGLLFSQRMSPVLVKKIMGMENPLQQHPDQRQFDGFRGRADLANVTEGNPDPPPWQDHAGS